MKTHLIDLFLLGLLQTLQGKLTPRFPHIEHFFIDSADANKDLLKGSINFSLFFKRKSTILLADFGPIPGNLENK